MPGRSLHGAAIFGLLLMCAACATPYQVQDKDGFGYSFRQVVTGEYLVSFTANTATSTEQAQDFALLRAAQMAALLGYVGVAVLDTSSEDATLPTTAVSIDGGPAFVKTPGVMYKLPSNTNNRGRTVTLRVRFLTRPTGAAGTQVEDAQATIKRLSAKYSLHLAPATPHN